MTRIYACDRCTFAQYHPMSYCPMCPGRLHQREFMSPGSFQTTQDLVNHLKANGIDYIGEYPKVPPRKEIEITIQRYTEKIAEAADDMANDRIQNKKWNPVKYWTDLRDKEVEKLAQLGE
jgi:hypothetical protein